MARTRATRRRVRRPRRARNQGAPLHNSKLAQTFEQPIPSFFNDKTNPYHKSCDKVKGFFKQKQNLLTFENIDHDFPAQSDQQKVTDICPRNTQQNSETGFLCFTCFPDEYYRICQKCFDPNKHSGHFYRQDSCYSESYCYCGMITKSDIFTCQKHIGKPKQFSKKLSQERQQQFVVFFGDLFKILFYLGKRKFHENYHEIYDSLLLKLSQALIALTEGSNYYIDLTVRVMEMKIVTHPCEQQWPISIFQHLLIEGNYTSFCDSMRSSVSFCKTFAMHWAKPETPQDYQFYRKPQEGVSTDYISKVLNVNGVLKMLTQKDIILEDSELQKCYKQQSNQQVDGKSLFIYYLEKRFQKIAKNKQKCNLLISSIEQQQGFIPSPQSCKFILKNLINICLNPNQQKPVLIQKKQLKKIREHSQESGSDSDEQNSQQQEEEEQQNQQSQVDPFKQVSSLGSQSKKQFEEIQTNTFKNPTAYKSFDSIILAILRLSKGEIKQIENLFQKFLEMGFQEKHYNDFLKSFCFKKNVYIGSQYRTSLFFILARKSPNKKQLISTFFKTVFKQQNSFELMLNSIFEVLAKVAEIEIVLHKFKQINTESWLNSQKVMEQKLRQYLYARSKIYLDSIQSMKYQNDPRITQPNSAKILNELCTYLEQENQYVYTSNECYPSVVSTIFYQSLFPYNKLPTFDSEVKIEQLGFVGSLLKQILSQEQIFQKLSIQGQKYINKLKTDNDAAQNCRDEYYLLKYIAAMILVYHFTEGKSPVASKFLKNLRGNKQIRWKYEQYSDKQQLDKFLCDKQQQSEQEKSKQQENKQAQLQKIKGKAQSKKQKWLAKHKKKAQGIFKLQASKSMQQNEEQQQNQQVCLLCHQHQKQENPLVYIAMITKQQTLSSVIYNTENKVAVLISTCFHCIHLNCFKTIQKRNGIFSCMLCQKSCNCILPIKYNRSQKRLLKICSNIIIANMVNNANCLEVQSIFMLLFKHLVESKSLQKMVLGAKIESKKSAKTRIDQFIEAMLMDILQKSTAAERQQYLLQIDELLQDISNCKREQLREIQQFITKTLKSKILEGKALVDVDQLLRIKKLIKHQQFLMVLDQAEELSDQIIKLPEKKQQGQKQKKSLIFEPIMPPEDFTKLASFGGNRCSQCEQTRKFSVCLICGTTLCQDCHYSQKHRDEHKKRLFAYMHFEAEIVLQNKSNYQSEYVYASDFNINLNEISFGNHTNRDHYYLQKDRVQKIISKFFQI